jgi:hypothetical protein
MVLDVLDECAESEFADLMQNVESQFRSDQLGYGKLKYLLTCRPYDQIVSKFRILLDAFPKVHIPGDKESGTISQEVNHVIRRRINQLAMEKRLRTQIKNHLQKKLQEATHRTYLRVYLVFDYLQKHDFKKTIKGIESAVATLPTSVNEAYEQILNKTNKDPMVRKVLNIILAASRPLTLSEMNVAVNINSKRQYIDELDLEDNEDFKSRLRSWCGLFVSIHQDSIYFFHQKAREFLLADSAPTQTVSSELHWHHSITTRHAHAVLAKLCVLYLNFFNSNVGLLTEIDRTASHYVDKHSFLDYSAETWGAHFRKAEFIDDDSIVPFVLGICDTGLKSYSVWFNIYWETSVWNPTKCFTDLMIASYYGHCVIVKLLLEKGAEVEAKDSRYGRTPLSWAAENRREAVVKLLLEEGAEIETKDKYDRTPLSWAAENGHETVVKLLLVKSNSRTGDSVGRTPLLFAAKNGHDTVKMALIRYDSTDLDQEDHYASTPLSIAVRNSRTEIVNMLLATGQVSFRTRDRFGRTP